MSPHNWLLGGIIVLMLIGVSLMLILGWTWRLSQVINRKGSAAWGLRSFWFRTRINMPVPDDQDEDYLETRSFA